MLKATAAAAGLALLPASEAFAHEALNILRRKEQRSLAAVR
jgi:hypothetical protein